MQCSAQRLLFVLLASQYVSGVRILEGSVIQQNRARISLPAEMIREAVDLRLVAIHLQTLAFYETCCQVAGPSTLKQSSHHFKMAGTAALFDFAHSISSIYKCTNLVPATASLQGISGRASCGP